MLNVGSIYDTLHAGLVYVGVRRVANSVRPWPKFSQRDARPIRWLFQVDKRRALGERNTEEGAVHRMLRIFLTSEVRAVGNK